MIKTLYPQFQRWSEKGSVWIISDTHFDDADCKLMNKDWIPASKQKQILEEKCHRGDTLIHLGDVGEPTYLDGLKCHKVLLSGNHDVLSKVASHFDEVYNGPLFIADRILLSHEPIYGMEKFALNIHGHVHNGAWVIFDEDLGYITHINMAADVCMYTPMNLGKLINNGQLSKIPNYHRLTIDYATEHSLRNKNENSN